MSRFIIFLFAAFSQVSKADDPLAERVARMIVSEEGSERADGYFALSQVPRLGVQMQVKLAILDALESERLYTRQSAYLFLSEHPAYIDLKAFNYSPHAEAIRWQIASDLDAGGITRILAYAFVANPELTWLYKSPEIYKKAEGLKVPILNSLVSEGDFQGLPERRRLDLKNQIEQSLRTPTAAGVFDCISALRANFAF